MAYPTAGSESPQVASPAGDQQAAPRWTVRSAFDRGQFLFLDDEVRGRRRRPVDGLLVLIAALLLVVASLVANDSDLNEQHAVIAARTLLGWFDTGWRILYAAALGYGLLVLLAVLVTRRWQLSRDLLIALAAVLLIGLTIGRAVGGDWPSVTERLWPSVNQYPALRLAAVTAVLAVVGPELTRPARLVAVWLVGLGCVAALVLGIGYPSSLLGGIALGLAVAGLIRLTFGSSAGFPSSTRVIAGLADLGTVTNELTIARRQRPGSATYAAVDTEGTPLQVIVLGRDARDTQRLANTWRNLAYREGSRDLAPGRLQQVEHESLITLLAEQAGVVVPHVRVAGVVESGDAMLVLEQPEVDAVEESADDFSDEALTSLWQQAAKLRAARLAHGAFNLSNVLATESGPMIVRFNRGQLAATSSVLNIDTAELLVATSIAVGPERALAAALDTIGSDSVAATLPYLQRAALTPHLRDLARNHELSLKELRSQAAAATRTDLPAIAPLRRVTIRDVLLMVLVAVGAYLIITQLAKVGFDTIYDQLRQAKWQWVVVALLLAQLTFVTQAISLRGAVLTPLPLLPCTALQAAIKFINLTVPSSAGRIAINIRFLQRLGAPTGEAVASGAVDGFSESIVQIVLVLLLLPFVHLDLKLSPAKGGNDHSTLWLIVGLLAAVAVVVTLVMAVPKWRIKVLPTVKTAWTSMIAVARTRSKRIQLFGGNLATQVLFALTLGAACHAYGVHLTLAELLIVNMGASVFASIVPVPGGIGVAEGGLTAGLVAFGVSQPIAFAAALTHRLCTYYLPPIWGYIALRWLNHKDYL